MKSIALLIAALLLALPGSARAGDELLADEDATALAASLGKVQVELQQAQAAKTAAEQLRHGVAAHKELKKMQARLSGKPGPEAAALRTGVEGLLRHLRGDDGFAGRGPDGLVADWAPLNVALRDLFGAWPERLDSAFGSIPTSTGVQSTSNTGVPTSAPTSKE